MRGIVNAYHKLTEELVKLRPDLKGHVGAGLVLAAAGTYKDDPEGARFLFDSGVSLVEEKTMPLISDFLAAVSAGVEHFKTRQQAGAAAVKPGADADVAAIDGAVARIDERTAARPAPAARPATGWRPAPAPVGVPVTPAAPVAVTAPPAAPVAVTAPPAAPVAVTAPPAAPLADAEPTLAAPVATAPASEPQ